MRQFAVTFMCITLIVLGFRAQMAALQGGHRGYFWLHAILLGVGAWAAFGLLETEKPRRQKEQADGKK